MIKTLFISFLTASALAATPALAAPSDGATAKNAAVTSLESFTRIAPSDGGAYVELAQAYLRAGRNNDASVAYARALELDNVMLVTANGGSVWSHQIARDALAKLPAMPQLSSR